MIQCTGSANSCFADLSVDSKDWISPPALSHNDTVTFVAPAGPIDIEKVRKARAVFEKVGLRVDVPKGLARKNDYLAGSDEQRTEELNAAIADPNITAIFPCRGGYGLTRILDNIDYQLLRTNPKIIAGFSDITALHLAIARKSRVITFHSPMPQCYLWDESEDYAFSATALWRTVMRSTYQDTHKRGFVVETSEKGPQPKKLTGGCAYGRLIGGNMTLISITLSTPYAIEPNGSILVLEDINEDLFKIDRYFSQLRLAGILHAVNGIIIGTFTKSDKEHLEKQDRNEIQKIVTHYCLNLGVPVVTDFPIGHSPYNVTIPLGAKAKLDADQPSLMILENPVKVVD